MPAGAVVLRAFEGVNTSREARDIKDSNFMRATNSYQYKGGLISLRPQTQNLFAGGGYRFLNLGGPSPDQQIIIPFDDSNGVHHLLFWVDGFDSFIGTVGAGAALVEVADPALPSFNAILNYTNPVFPLSPQRAVDRPSWTLWNRKLYLFHGITAAPIPPSSSGPLVSQFPISGHVIAPDASGKLVAKNIADNVTSPSWVNNVIYPRLVTIYKNSFALAGFAAPNDSLIRWCNVNDPNTLLSDAVSITIAAYDNDPIVAMSEFPVVGGAIYAEPYAFVWKRNSVWLIQGNPPVSGATSTNLNVSVVVREEGITAKETLAWTPYGQVWASHRNVWIAPFGQTPVRIGDEIRDLFMRAPRDAKYAWHACYFNGFYRLTIPSSSLTDEATATQFLTPTEQWWCDLRDFPKVSWWGPMKFPANASAVEKLRDGTLRPVHTFNSYNEPSALNTFKWYAVEGDVFTANRLDAHTGILPENAPQMELWFKEFDFGDPMLDKVLIAIEAHLSVDRNATVTLTLYGDGGQQVTIPGVINPQAQGMVLDTSALDSGSLAHAYQSWAFYPPDGTRFVAKTIQPVLRTVTTQTAGVEMRFKALGIRMKPIGRRPS